MRPGTGFRAVLLAAALSSAATSTPAAAGATLAEAAMQGDVAAIRSLLAHGADVNASQPDGMTPLHWAALGGDADAAGSSSARARRPTRRRAPAPTRRCCSRRRTDTGRS